MPQLRKDVESSVALDALTRRLSQGELGVMLDKSVGDLDNANDQKRTVIQIVDVCEAEKNEALKELQPRKWWQPWK